MPSNPHSCVPGQPALELLAEDGRNFANWTLVDEMYPDRTERVWRKRMESPHERHVTECGLADATGSDYFALCGELMHWLWKHSGYTSIDSWQGTASVACWVKSGEDNDPEVFRDDTGCLLTALTAAVVATVKGAQ